MTDTSCQVTNCGHPLPADTTSTACPQCWNQLDQQLGDIPALTQELDTTISRQTATGSRNGPRSSETPLPFNTAASEALRLLASTMRPWVKEGRHHNPHVPLTGQTPAHLAAALMHLTPWLRTHPHGHEAIEEITYATSQAQHAIDRAPDRTYAGTCDTQDCKAELYAAEGASGVLCPVCGALRDVHAWRRSRLEAAADQLLTLSELTRAIGETGTETVSRKRLEGWVRRGRLIRSGHIGPTPTYRVGDVLAILHGTQIDHNEDARISS